MEPGPEQLWERENCCHTTIEHCRSVPCPGRNRSRPPIRCLNRLSRNLLPRYSEPFNRGYTPPTSAELRRNPAPSAWSLSAAFHPHSSVSACRAEVLRRRVRRSNSAENKYYPTNLFQIPRSELPIFTLCPFAFAIHI